jgi:hypothetical protein
MSREKYLAKTMSRVQRETYTQIKEDGKFIAKGNLIATCKVLMQLGLVVPNPEAGNVNEYVLKGKPLNIPFTKKMPLPKDIVKEVIEAQAGPKHTAIVWAQSSKAPAIYSNVSREQHVSRWLSEPVKVKAKKFSPVKCLTQEEMEYIIDNYEKETVKEMAAYLGRENMDVILFCQKNAIEAKQPGKKKKHLPI